tara:strand:+ start:338 stop:709 length:372 start_codon:yes stop_codon:yes gene_type:complete
MATLTSTITLSSTDVSSDSLNLSVSKSLTTTNPAQGPSRVSVAVSATEVLYADSGSAGSVYFYIKNCNTSGTGSIDLRNDAGNTFGTLDPGEFAFFPADTDEGVEVFGMNEAVVVEYAYFTKA